MHNQYSIDRWTPPPAPPHHGNAHAVCKLRPCGEKMATPKSARCYEHEAIDPFHAQEAQQTCWVEKEKCESATISDGCFHEIIVIILS